MEGFIYFQANTGRALRVCRRGFHFTVEEKQKDGSWEAIWKVAIDEHDEPALALRACVRKLILFADDFTQLGQCLSMVKAHDSQAHTDLRSIINLPRDEFLTARIPTELKLALPKLASEVQKRAGLRRFTVTDYVVWKLGSGDVQ